MGMDMDKDMDMGMDMNMRTDSEVLCFACLLALVRGDIQADRPSKRTSHAMSWPAEAGEQTASGALVREMTLGEVAS